MTLAAGRPALAQGQGAPPAQGNEKAAASSEQELKKLLAQAKQAAKQEQWDKARALLSEAFKLQPSYEIAAKLGSAELNSGKFRDAAEHLAFFLREAQGISGEDRQIGETLLAEAKSKIGTVTIRVDVEGAEVLVDGQQVGTSPMGGPVFVEPGRRALEARKDGRSSGAKAVEVAAGSAPEVELKVAKKPAPVAVLAPVREPEVAGPAGGERNKALIGAGIGMSVALAAVGAGTAIGAVVASQQSKALNGKSDCIGQYTCRDNFYLADGQRISFGSTAIYASIGAGLIGGATAIYALTGNGAGARSSAKRSLVVRVQGSGFTLIGSF